MNIGAYLITNLVNGIMAMALLLAGFFIFNLLTPKWDFEEVFRAKGISGGAVIVAAFLLGMSIVIAAGCF